MLHSRTQHRTKRLIANSRTPEHIDVNGRSVTKQYLQTEPAELSQCAAQRMAGYKETRDFVSLQDAIIRGEHCLEQLLSNIGERAVKTRVYLHRWDAQRVQFF